jgi:hypothetical protein
VRYRKHRQKNETHLRVAKSRVRRGVWVVFHKSPGGTQVLESFTSHVEAVRYAFMYTEGGQK